MKIIHTLTLLILGLINLLWHRLNLRVQFFLNAEEVLFIVFCDEIDSQSQVSKSPASSDSVQISLTGLWEIKIDNDVHALNIDSSGKEIRTDQTSTVSITEIVENLVSIVLGHFCMNIVACVSQFDDLLSQQFYSKSRVAENDGLINK